MLERWWKLLVSDVIYPLVNCTVPVSEQVLAPVLSPEPLLNLRLAWGPLGHLGSSLCATSLVDGHILQQDQPGSEQKRYISLAAISTLLRSSSDHLSFPVNPLGSTSSPVPANTSRSYQFQGLGKVRSYFGMYVTLKSVANHEVIARTGWKNDFIWLFFFCHKKQIYSNWNCGKRDDFNRFSSLRKGYKSSKAISSLFFFFSWLEVWHCLFIYLLFNIEITFHS